MVNTSVLTDVAKTVTELTIAGYGNGVAAHLGADWAGHSQVRVHTGNITDSNGDVIAPFSLRLLATRDNAGVPEDVVLALPINLTGSTALSGQLPIIIRHPQNTTQAQGSTAQFTVTAISGTPLAYQWQKTEANITGATAVNLVLPNIQSTTAGRYRCVVTNSSGSVFSNNGTLSVGPPSSVVISGGAIGGGF